MDDGARVEITSDHDQARETWTACIRLTSVGSVGDLRLEADGANGTTAARPLGDGLVVGAGVVPRETNHQGVRVGLVQKVGKSRLAVLELLDLLGGDASVHGKLQESAAST